MNRFFISIGSNLEPEKNIPACLTLLKKEFEGIKRSSVYETDPVGPAGDKKFWNLVVQIQTPLDKKSLVEKMREIEKQLGRKREAANRFAARTIDLDLLPTPDYADQGFVIIPLAEMAPAERDPVSGKTFRELAEPFRTQRGLRKISSLLL